MSYEVIHAGVASGKKMINYFFSLFISVVLYTNYISLYRCLHAVVALVLHSLYCMSLGTKAPVKAANEYRVRLHIITLQVTHTHLKYMSVTQ